MKLETRIKTPFGEIVVAGENPQEILNILKTFPDNFVEELSNVVSNKLIPSGIQLKGIVEFTTEGPVIVTCEKLTHYEAIGLILFSSEDRTNTATKITQLLESSGIKCMVPARINEMTKKNRIFKPNPNKPEFKLTMKGEKWIDEVVAKLRGIMMG